MTKKQTKDLDPRKAAEVTGGATKEERAAQAATVISNVVQAQHDAAQAVIRNIR